MRVRVDPDRCVGHGRCYVLAPEVFSEDERGHCVVTRAEVTLELEPLGPQRPPHPGED